MKNTTIIAAGSAFLFAAPAMAADVVIGVPNWASVNATAHVLEVVIEENLGLDVELQNGTNPIVFEAMDKGSMHAHPEVWMPNQQNLHDTYVKDSGTVVMNQNPVQAEQGMCVPTATAEKYDIKSIDDLSDPDKMAIFDTDGNGTPEVWIGAPGWASTVVEKIRAKSYGYDQIFELTEYEETIAYANLANAAQAGEPWVGFCYSPHYIFVTQDLTVLEEPAHDPATWTIVQPTDDPDWLAKSEASTAWNGATLHLHYAKELEETYPEVASLFANFQMDGESLSAMGKALAVDGQEAAAFAKEWVAANEETVLGWLTN
ncbi:glycine betaine ABC transporter substrate-binding protein [uncultured Roseobacter sp.]|uniref:ABC transporter substrate-binding protein n=1 Tax=uncultured Roseobacter sp. TaxID=114847 RepID=UPI00261E6FA1|nr:glycine betaine ABC transporter substrate-binding protein [uncultured Roseobacter sp.]